MWTQQSNNAVLLNQKISVEAGKTYEVSAWVRPNELHGLGFRIYSEFSNDLNQIVGTIGSEYHKPVPGEWQKVTVQLTAPAGASIANVYFRLYGHASYDEEIDLDDVSVIELKNE